MFPAADTHYSNTHLRPILTAAHNRHSRAPSSDVSSLRSFSSISEEFLPERTSLYSHVTSTRGSIIDEYGIRHSSRCPSPDPSLYSQPNYSQLAFVNEKLPLARDQYDISDVHELNCKGPEADDELHNPQYVILKIDGNDRRVQDPFSEERRLFTCPSFTGFLNLLALLLIVLALCMMFAGYPIIVWFTKTNPSKHGGFGLGGANLTGQVPDLPGFRGLIDNDTPVAALTRKGFDGFDYELVFSDEFNVEGRSFNPGDDPYWEAVNLHYYGTNDLEWYHPDWATTHDGKLYITMTKDDPGTLQNHNLHYTSAMLQSWNKFCFTGGYIEILASLPGDDIVPGFWPAAWVIGNIGRAGHGASLEGTWPYSYDTCDIGTLPNQTAPTGGPPATTESGDPNFNYSLSFLPGQKLSACTCPGENHPGPIRPDGSYVGRAAAEIDILEIQTVLGIGGENSQSAQWAPYDPNYLWDNSTTDTHTFYLDNGFETHQNPYVGGVFQEVTSGLSTVPSNVYNGTKFITYGFEYRPHDFITWFMDDKQTWTLNQNGMKANAEAEIGERIISPEPMSIVLNFAMSNNFGAVDEDSLHFPAFYAIDHIRVYQRAGEKNIGCSPPDFPTEQYIQDHLEAYMNSNLTIWSDYKNSKFPKNKLTGC